MADFTGVVLQLEPPEIPMVRCNILPSYFHMYVTPDCASPSNHVYHIWVVCIRLLDSYLCQNGIKIRG